MLRILWAALMAGTLSAAEKPKTPADGTAFVMSPSAPKYATCDLEFRDASGELWPSFYYGKPTGDGSFVFDSKAPKAAFGLDCNKAVQTMGDQSRRVLGELVTEGKSPPAVFRVTATRPPEEREVSVEEKGKAVVKKVTVVPVDAELTIGERIVKLKDAYLRANYRFEKNKDVATTAALDVFFTFVGSDMDLKNAAAVTISGRAGVTAFRELPQTK